jgi:hypothetical protein
MQVHGKSPQHAECACQTLRLHRLSGFVDFQAFHASTRVGVHTRRLTPTHTQEAEAAEEQSDASIVELTTKEMKKRAVGGGDTGERMQTRPRHTRGDPKPASPPRTGEAPATSPHPQKVVGVHCLVDFAGFHGSLFLDFQA